MPKQARMFIVIFKRCSLLVIDSQSVFDSIFSVIFTLDQVRLDRNHRSRPISEDRSIYDNLYRTRSTSVCRKGAVQFQHCPNQAKLRDLSFCSDPCRIETSASACGIVRGKPSKTKPLSQSESTILSRTIPRTTSSGTRPPDSIICLATSPKAVCSLTAARNISPVDICGILKLSTINFACVPLPAPGGPNRTRFIVTFSP